MHSCTQHKLYSKYVGEGRFSGTAQTLFNAPAPLNNMSSMSYII